MVGKHLAKKTSNYTLSKLHGCVNENDPTQALERLGKAMRQDYTSGAYFCVETQQCATNVILNPELHVLRIVSKKTTFIESIN